MTREFDSLPRERTVFADRRSIGVSLYMALVGYGVLYLTATSPRTAGPG